MRFTHNGPTWADYNAHLTADECARPEALLRPAEQSAPEPHIKFGDDLDVEMRCGRCDSTVPFRWRPSPEAGPQWRCSQCGEPRATAAKPEPQKPADDVELLRLIRNDAAQSKRPESTLAGRALARIEELKARVAELERDGNKALSLRRIADELKLDLPGNFDPVQAIVLDIKRLLHTERLWTEACEVTKAHVRIGDGESCFKVGVPRLTKERDDLLVQVEALKALLDDKDYVRELAAQNASADSETLNTAVKS